MIGFTFLFTQSKNEYSFLFSIKSSFLSIFGNLLEEDENDPYDISVWFIIGFIGIMITLILSNFLIAIMSSKYGELELKQQIISLQGQADMIQEIEIGLRLFENKIHSLERKWFLILLVPNNENSYNKKLKKSLKIQKQKKNKKLLKKAINEMKKKIDVIEKSNFQMENTMIEMKNKMSGMENKFDELNLLLKEIAFSIKKNK